MAALPYTKKLFIQRIRKHVSNDRLTGDDFNISDKEILLYIDQAAASRIVGQTYMNAKIDGALAVPEAYLITYQLTNLSQDDASGYWYTTLPQPPLSLPLGYSVNQVYTKDLSTGVSQPFFMIKAKRVPRRMNMPMPDGIRCWVENNTLWLVANNGQSLLGLPIYIQMPSARTTDINAVMNMPEDDIEFVFMDVIGKIKDRYGIPQDTIKDDLGQGNKSS